MTCSKIKLPRKSPNLWVSLICSAVCTQAVFLYLGRIFGAFSPALAAACAAYVALKFLCDLLSRKQEKIRILPSAVLVILAAFSLSGLVGQLSCAANALMQYVYQRYGVNVVSFTCEKSAAARLFLTVALTAALTAAVCTRHRAVRVSVSAALLLFGLAFSTDGATAALMLTAAAMPIFSAHTVREILGFLPKLAAFGAAFAVMLGVGLSDTLSQTVSDKVCEIRYSGDGYEAPKGDLSAAGSFTPTGAAALEVSASTPEALYLQGFVGYDYSDGAWQELDFSSLSLSSDDFAYLHSVGFTADAQAAKLIGLQGGEDYENDMLIRNIGADSQYFYLPVGLVGGDFNSADIPAALENKARFFSPDESYSVTAVKGFSDYGAVFPDLLAAARESGSSDAAEYLSCAALTDSLYKENFTDVPDSVCRILDAQLGDYDCESGDLSGAAQVIYDYLGAFEYDTLAAGQSAEEFLQETKSGYSIHFATAAALIFRYYGIPARYAEGYVVTEQAVADKLSYSAITLTDSDFHAWAEYYVEGVGWLPFEATPEYFDKMPLATGISASESAQYEYSVPADTSQYAQNRVSGDRISQKITDPDPEEERLPNVFIPVLATLTLILIAALRLIFIRRKTARHPDFALARCARLISSRQDFSPDSSGRYPADSLSDRTVADEFRLLQSECERLYYSQNANKVGKYTFGDVAAKCVRLSRGYACGGKNVFGKIRVYLVDFFCG